ncbi:MAG: galactose oxidase-like domain-containing protein [Candidatus Dormiibacterota bacterium]
MASVVVASAAILAPTTAAQGAGLDPASAGMWTVPFEQDPTNSQYPVAAGPTEHCFQQSDATLGTRLICKPAASNSTVLPDGRVVYWNGLEGLENVKTSVVIEGGLASRNSQARVLDLSGSSPSWAVPHPEDGGATNPDAGTGPPWPVPGNNGFNNNPEASGDMFCSDQVHLANGMVLIAGGTAWYDQPLLPGTNYGVVELQGLRSTRLFNPANNTFTNLEPMNYGRWYPTLIELGSGNVFVGGGVRKLIQTDGTNVKNTEIYNPNTGHWTDNGASGSAALPLFPRLHLLPNGSIYYSGAGQMWGPAGESADEALYTLHQSYSPTTNSWTPYGFGVLGARSGSYSVLLPLKAPYTHAVVMTGGGTLGPPPGGYIANNLTEISTFDASAGWVPTFSPGPTMNRNRWFGTSVTLPNDAIAVFNGATQDEVIDPGSESPVHTAEWYTPWDNSFHPLSDMTRDRTYHNSAVLLPDGSVLIGGHAPINADYLMTNNIRHDVTAGTPFGTANNFRDPSFEIFKPPYMFKDTRPAISSVQSGVGYGGTFHVNTNDAASISSVRLIRMPAETHDVDGNMRSVELPIVSRGASSITVQAPPNGSVAPPAPYYLFINRGVAANLVPSTAAIVSVGADNPAAAAIPVLAASGGMSNTVTHIDPATGTNAIISQLPTLPAPPVIIPGVHLGETVQTVPGLLTVAAVSSIAMALAILPRRRRGRRRQPAP